jgi:type II secretory pathway component PulC
MKHITSIGLLSLALFACGGAKQETPKTSAHETKVATPAAPEPAPSAAALTRTQLKSTVADGLGVFLQNVDLDDHPVFSDGKFHGFRVLALRDGLAKSGLLAGDVVVSVNKMPIERPEQALAVFRGLETASEVRVDYERNGEPKTLTVPVLDDTPSAPSAAPQAPTPTGPAMSTTPATQQK